MSDVVSLSSGRSYSVEKLLATVDNLREAIVNGEVTTLATVGLAPDNAHTFYWVGSTRPTSPLLLEGAISRLLHHFQHDSETR